MPHLSTNTCTAPNSWPPQQPPRPTMSSQSYHQASASWPPSQHPTCCSQRSAVLGAAHSTPPTQFGPSQCSPTQPSRPPMDGHSTQPGSSNPPPPPPGLPGHRAGTGPSAYHATQHRQTPGFPLASQGNRFSSALGRRIPSIATPNQDSPVSVRSSLATPTDWSERRCRPRRPRSPPGVGPAECGCLASPCGRNSLGAHALLSPRCAPHLAPPAGVALPREGCRLSSSLWPDRRPIPSGARRRAQRSGG